MDSTLGKRITANRKHMGLTQDQLAEKLGITAQAVSKWENDLSCPDISILPKLADIFGITTDELLGRDAPAKICEAEIIPRRDDANAGFTYDNDDTNTGFTYDSDSGKMDFHWEGIKLEGISLAVWVILTGLVYLAVQFLGIEVSIWNILWPAFLLVFGAFGLFPKFSVFRLGCALAGGFFLLEKLQIISTALNSGMVIAVVILLFGLGLLSEALRKCRHPFRSAGKAANEHHGKLTRDYTVDGDGFSYDASFGDAVQTVLLDKLRNGSISVSFGDYTVDLGSVASLDVPCSIHADCSFGALTILVPRRFTVVPESSTSFASFEMQGHPDKDPVGTIHLSTDVSFGEICVRYI